MEVGIMKLNTLDKVTAAKMTVLLSAAVVTASSMSGIKAYAAELPDAYNAAEVAEQVLAPTVVDPTKFDFFGNCVLTHDKLGSPDPQIVNNGDGTYVIIMYVGQSVAFPVNNLWADMGLDQWGNPRVGYPVFINNNDFATLTADVGDFGLDTLSNFVIKGVAEGSTVVEVGVKDAMENVVSNTVTVGLFVLPAVPGAQTPTLTQAEIKNIQSMQSPDGKHKPGSTFYSWWN